MGVSADDYEKTAERLNKVRIELDRIVSRQRELLDEFRQITYLKCRRLNSPSAPVWCIDSAQRSGRAYDVLGSSFPASSSKLAS